MIKFLLISFLSLFIFQNSNAYDFLYKQRYFEIPYDKVNDNCGYTFAIGKIEQYVANERFDPLSTWDFKGKSLIFEEHRIFKSDKKIKIFQFKDFDEPLFEKEFELIFNNNEIYIFSQDFERFPDDEYYKNIILFQIDRLNLEITMGSIYIKSKSTYKKYKKIDFSNRRDENFGIYSITSLFNNSIRNTTDEMARETSLSYCLLKEVSKKEPKI